MANRSTATSIDEYIAEFPPEIQTVLREMRAVVRAAAPNATERISYAMPTFDLNGTHLAHFAAFKQHIGFYPGASGIEAFQGELTSFKSARGSVQFPLGQPLPVDLIRRIVAFRVEESLGRASRRAVTGSVGASAGFPAGMGSPARRALSQAGYERLEQLAGVRESDLRRLHGMGPKAIGLLRAALAVQGLSFADEGEG